MSGTGNAQANSIFGNTGNNTLDGQGGADVLTGNAGNDTFVFHMGQGSAELDTAFTSSNAQRAEALLVTTHPFSKRSLLVAATSARPETRKTKVPAIPPNWLPSTQRPKTVYA